MAEQDSRPQRPCPSPEVDYVAPSVFSSEKHTTRVLSPKLDVLELPRDPEFGADAPKFPFPADVNRYRPLWGGGRLRTILSWAGLSSAPLSLQTVHTYRDLLQRGQNLALQIATSSLEALCRAHGLSTAAVHPPIAAPLAPGAHSPLDIPRITLISDLARKASLSLAQVVQLVRGETVADPRSNKAICLIRLSTAFEG